MEHATAIRMRAEIKAGELLRESQHDARPHEFAFG